MRIVLNFFPFVTKDHLLPVPPPRRTPEPRRPAPLDTPASRAIHAAATLRFRGVTIRIAEPNPLPGGWKRRPKTGVEGEFLEGDFSTSTPMCAYTVVRREARMLANAFMGKPTPPGDGELAAELGTIKNLWDQLLIDLANDYDVNEQEWSSYSRKAGWALKLKRKQRTIVYLSPGHDAFLASFALGDRAVQAARQSGLPRRVVKLINDARHYAEGTAVRIEVKRPEDVDAIKKLAKAKLDN